MNEIILKQKGKNRKTKRNNKKKKEGEQVA
jgi:hypothetical protein